MTSRERFEAHVRSELGDVAVMDAGRYISPKIHNHWLTWQAADALEAKQRPDEISIDDLLAKLAPVDCRTCEHCDFEYLTGRPCVGDICLTCTKGNKHQALPIVQLYRAN